MSAPKRKRSQTKAWRFPRDNAQFNRWLDEVDQPQTTAWLRPRVNPDPPASFCRSVLGYPDAKAAFEKVTSAGFDKDLLWRHLWGLAHLKKATGNQKSPWYALPVPPHTLRRFPQKVRDMADQIEKLGQQIQSEGAYGMTVNFLPLFLAGAIPGTSIEWSVDGDVVREVGAGVRGVPADRARDLLRRQAELPKLDELPNLLRLYADYIEMVSKLTAHQAPRGATTLKAMMPLELIAVVKKLTGKPNWDAVATLLTAAYAAAGRNTIVDPKSLQMQHSRKK